MRWLLRLLGVWHEDGVAIDCGSDIAACLVFSLWRVTCAVLSHSQTLDWTISMLLL